MYTIEITIEADGPLTQGQLFAVAAIGRAAIGLPGGSRIEATLTETGADMLEALARAAERIRALVPGRLIAVEAMTAEEADRRLASGEPILGLQEVATLLGVTKQRVCALAKRADFPAPAAALAQGKAWHRTDVERFAASWNRKPGRPYKTTPPAG
jgi:hypothetical protein